MATDAGGTRPLTQFVAGNGQSAVSYQLPAGLIQYVQSVVATINTAAAGDVTPLLTVTDDAGIVVADKEQDDAIDAGGSGRATWALRLTDSKRGYLRFGRNNVGKWIQVEVTGGSPTSFLGAVFLVHPSAGGGFTILSAENANESYSYGGGVSWSTGGDGINIDTTDSGGNGSFSPNTGQVNWVADGYQFDVRAGAFNVGGGKPIVLGTSGGEDVQINANGGRLGFFGVGPIAQEATPVTLGDVIALLQAYGLAA